jgi:cysteine sulfinate desulfinase/cysteine desulfurase-like protein
MESQAHAAATGAATYTEYSPNFAAMDKAAKARAENMDFSKAGHRQMRDYIVDVVSQCVKIANA